jgi:hypothetical protein
MEFGDNSLEANVNPDPVGSAFLCSCADVWLLFFHVLPTFWWPKFRKKNHQT